MLTLVMTLTTSWKRKIPRANSSQTWRASTSGEWPQLSNSWIALNSTRPTCPAGVSTSQTLRVSFSRTESPLKTRSSSRDSSFCLRSSVYSRLPWETSISRRRRRGISSETRSLTMLNSGDRRSKLSTWSGCGLRNSRYRSSCRTTCPLWGRARKYSAKRWLGSQAGSRRMSWI